MNEIQKKIASLPGEKRALFEIMLREQGVDLSQIMITPQDRETDVFPLSFSQQRLWFLDRLEPGSPLYNINSVIRMRGNIDVGALQQSFNHLVDRHEVLRTYFIEKDGQALQKILPGLKLDMPVIDLQDTPADAIDQRLHEQAIAESLKPFDLSKGPLLRTTLLKFAEDHHALLLTMHHIVSDNWSTGLIVREILELYRAFSEKRKPDLAELPVQYADFAVWQRKWLQDKVLEMQLDYWREKLQKAPSLIQLPTDHPRPAYQTHNGDYLTFEIGRQDKEALKKLTRGEEVTLFMALLAAFDILLYRYSGQDDILVGTPIANRNRSETENVLGFFVNTLVMRADFSEKPAFKDLLKQVKEDNLGAQDHQDIPFETLVEALQPERDMSHSPFFQTMFVLNNAPVEKLNIAGMALEVIEIENKTAKFDLVLNALETDDAIQFKLEYNTDLFNRDTMERLSDHYKTIIRSVCADPALPVDKLDILNEAEKEKLISDFSRPEKWYDEKTNVIELFEKRVQTSAESLALRIADGQWTFRELDRESDRLAGHLLEQGLSAGDIAGIYADRSPELIIALLAVMKAGGTFLPLDPAYPAERLSYMIADSGAKFILFREHQRDSLPENQCKPIVLDGDEADWKKHPDKKANHKIKVDDAAYIIYTSGSTGKPKGVVVEHGLFADHCMDMRDHFALTADDNVLQFAALNFDAALEQLFPPLISGATVVMRDNEIWATSEFHQKIEKYDLSVINPPTAYWAQLTEEWTRNPDLIPDNRLRLVIVGGDTLEKETLKKWQQSKLKDVRILNAYGPTETIITAATYDIPSDFSDDESRSRVPIGRPRANRLFYVLDKNGGLCPVGVPGELHIGGTALARGYLKQPGLTGERFISNPFADSEKDRLYRSGDLVRFRSDGQLEFLGRVDDQVKVRGFRIELGEIEAALSEHPQLEKVIVLARPDAKNQKQLTAYFTAGGDGKPGAAALREFLKSKLPEYMLPSFFVAVDAMPLDPSGKIKRKALPDPEAAALSVETEYVAPRTETEQILADIVKEILNVEKVGVHDNFFELGGHSMMATQVVSRIREQFDAEVSLRTLFEHPTIEAIALAIMEEEASGHDEEELARLLDELENPDDDAD